MSTTKKSKGELCDLLRTNFVQLVDEFSHIYKQDPTLKILATWFQNYNNEVSKGQKPYNEMMLKFIEHVYPYKSQINEESEVYFAENADKLFHDNLGYCISIKKYIFGKDSNGRNILNEGQKKTIWKYFKVFVKLMDKYIEIDPSSYYKKFE